MLQNVIDKKITQPLAILGFWPANSVGDDIEIYEDESHVVGTDFLISRKIEDGKVEIPVQAFIQLYKNGLIENNGLQLWSAPANSPFDKVRLTTQDVEVLYVKP